MPEITIEQLNKDFANREDPTSIGGACRNATGGDSVWQFGKHIATRHTVTPPDTDGPVYRWSADVAQWNCSPPREPVPQSVDNPGAAQATHRPKGK
jgi:hypothetical protein